MHFKTIRIKASTKRRLDALRGDIPTNQVLNLLMDKNFDEIHRHNSINRTIDVNSRISLGVHSIELYESKSFINISINSAEHLKLGNAILRAKRKYKGRDFNWTWDTDTSCTITRIN